jgi:hypothetical protein
MLHLKVGACYTAVLDAGAPPFVYGGGFDGFPGTAEAIG